MAGAVLMVGHRTRRGPLMLRYTVRMAISRPKAPRSRTPRQADPVSNLPEPIELTPEEAWNAYDALARELFGVPAEEFERRYDRGDYDDPQHHLKATSVRMRRTGRPAA